MNLSAASGGSSVTQPRVALVHDWLNGMRGGERTLEAICELFPSATRYSLFHVPGSVSSLIEESGIRTSFIQKLPLSHRYYRPLLPLFPAAVEQFDLDDFDLVISTSHCVAKSVVVPGRTRHLCYCFTPMRYAWDQFPAYFGVERVGSFASQLFRWGLSAMARWDTATEHRVDRYVAISQHVADRIHRYYNRDSTVIYPPVDTIFFTPGQQPIESYFLVVSALVPYKHIEIAIRACTIAKVPLHIVGDGPDRLRLETLAGSNVSFLGTLSNEDVRSQYQRAAAFLFPGNEDFGIAPVEAQACGRPVIALSAGGALETVIHNKTGILVDEASDSAFADAITHTLQQGFDETAIRKHALNYSRDRFQKAILKEISTLMAPAQGERHNESA
ncbi:MAG: glycosyl transferase [Acidobacteria bacterium]|nr:glycosyl transferase [Acidobacteriota bacterium]|tara:strand:- start:7591 stop:8754 length:1164 start_codon:yes stop_codon:yes gene_type:complete